jgi:hypothetical protein
MFGPAHAACSQASRRARLGYVPDASPGKRPDARDLMLANDWSGGVHVALTPLDLFPYFGDFFDQGGEGACGGAGTAKAAKVAHRGSLPSGMADCSPGYFYRIARRYSTPATSADGPPLTDSGVDPESLIRVMDWGLVPIGTGGQCPTPDGRYFDLWSDTEGPGGNVNADVTLGAETAGLVSVDVSAHDVDVSAGTDLLFPALQLPRACTAVGIFVDTPFEQWTPGNGPLDGLANLNDPDGGGHWVCLPQLVGVDASGRPIWGIGNSWSKQWGDGGKIQVTDRRMASMLSQAIVFQVNAP